MKVTVRANGRTGRETKRLRSNLKAGAARVSRKLELVQKDMLAIHGMKQCTDCSKVLPLRSFNGRRTGHLGLSQTCRWCQIEYYEKKRRENPEKYRGYNKTYEGRNKGRNSARRAKRRDAEGSFTESDLLRRFEYHGNRCIYCKSTENLTVEHMIPLSRGGTNWPANLAPACRSCNCSKNNKTITEYKEHMNEKTVRNS